MAYADFEDDYEDIRPYTDAELKPVLRRLSRNDWLAAGVRSMVFPRCPNIAKPIAEKLVKLNLWSRLRRIDTIDQFQRKIIIDRVLDYIIKRTIESVSSSGEEYLEPEKPYLYVSNHRDIVMDSALVNYIMVKTGKAIAEIAFGDNLLVNEFVSDLIRINRSFIVRRDGSLKERAKAALTLSRYVSYTMTQGNSVWLAQREGRAKDGNDQTNPSIIKMLYYGPKREHISFSDYIRNANIVPVAVSYEVDPCDVLKARELHRTNRSGSYRKRKGEDLLSMYTGLSGWKGRVHIGFGKPLEGDFENAADVAEGIDNAIHSCYHLWPTNYIAHDELSGARKYSPEYSSDEAKKFLHRFRRESADVRSFALKIYANAVVNKLERSPA